MKKGVQLTNLFIVLFLVTITSTAFAQNQYVLDLRGSNAYCQVTNSESILDLGPTCTVEAWLYINPHDIESTERIFYRSGAWQVYIKDGTVPGTNFQIVFDTGNGTMTSSDIPMGEWHHFSFTSDEVSARTRLHVDGSSTSSLTRSSDLPAITDYLRIGSTGWNAYLDGAIDEIRISNTARYGWAYTITKDDDEFVSDANTILLMNFEDQTTSDKSSNNLSVNNTNITAANFSACSNPSFSEQLALPVELTSFASTVSGNNVILNWTTATETNNLCFEIEKKAQGSEWNIVGMVDGKGNSNSVTNYTYTDNKVSAGKYTYRLKQIDFDGTSEYSNEIEVTLSETGSYALAQNYPNPFNPVTNIKFSIPTEGHVSLKIYNIAGEEIATLINGYRNAGEHTARFDANAINGGLASGFYIYELRVGEFRATKKLLLMK